MTRNNNNNMIARVAAAVVVVAVLSAGGTDAVDKCAGLTGYVAAEYCPYGYVPSDGAQAALPLTVEKCCAQDTSIVSFPACNTASSGGASTGVQALNSDASSWLIQDGNGFTRTVGRFTGMCFTAVIDTTDCDVLDTVCCTAKRPAYMQLKITAAAKTAATTTNKCRLSYGTATAGVNSLKRITTWSTAGTGNVVNVPLTWKKNAKATTVCVYTVGSVDEACKFETMCGVGDTPTVPDTEGSFADGCELRMVGRATAASSSCCTAPFAVEAFDSTVENRMAGGGAAGTIELNGA